MAETDYDELLRFATDLAKDAGAIIRHYFHTADQGVAVKPDATIVTVADTEVNDLVIRRVAAQYPQHGVLGEEASSNADRRELWVCDPIDGTNGFTIGEPTAAFSIAYVVDGVPILAVTYDPFQDRLYSAVKGRGAFCNGQVLRVSSRQLQSAILGLGGSFAEIDTNIELYRSLRVAGVNLRALGGLVFKGNMVAEGKIDGVLFPHAGAHDLAAIKLIVEEAGGKVTDVDGGEQRYDRPLKGGIISNGVIHDDLVAQLKAFGTKNYRDYKKRQ